MYASEAQRILGSAVTNFHDASYATGGEAALATEEAVLAGNEFCQSLRESLGVLSIYVIKSNEALRNGQEALSEAQGIRPLESLSLYSMGDAKARLIKAESLFGVATEAASQAIATIPVGLLKPELESLGQYTKSSKEVVGGAENAQERTQRAKAAVDQVFGEASDEPIPQKTNLFIEQLQEFAGSTREADAHIIDGSKDEGDAHRLGRFMEDLGVSLSFMRAAIEKPLDTFVMIVKDANSKVTIENLQYLGDLIRRMEQGTSAHQAIGEEGKRLGEVANQLRIAVLDFIKTV